jgi:hypothetical protein
MTPRAFDQDNWNEMIRLVRAGMPIRHACAYTRISLQSYYNWIKGSDVLKADAEAAEAFCQAAIVIPMFDRARKGNQRAAEFILRNRWPQDWGTRETVAEEVPEEKDTNWVKDKIEAIAARLAEAEQEDEV